MQRVVQWLFRLLLVGASAGGSTATGFMTGFWGVTSEPPKHEYWKRLRFRVLYAKWNFRRVW